MLRQHLGFENLMNAYLGGGGVNKPQKLAYIIVCERPHRN